MRWLSINRVSTFVRRDCNERAMVNLPTPGKPFNMTKQPESLGVLVDIVGGCRTPVTILEVLSWCDL